MHCSLAECEENNQLVEEMVDVFLGMANDEEPPMDSSSQGYAVCSSD